MKNTVLFLLISMFSLLASAGETTKSQFVGCVATVYVQPAGLHGQDQVNNSVAYLESREQVYNDKLSKLYLQRNAILKEAVARDGNTNEEENDQIDEITKKASQCIEMRTDVAANILQILDSHIAEY